MIGYLRNFLIFSFRFLGQPLCHRLHQISVKSSTIATFWLSWYKAIADDLCESQSYLFRIPIRIPQKSHLLAACRVCGSVTEQIGPQPSSRASAVPKINATRLNSHNRDRQPHCDRVVLAVCISCSIELTCAKFSASASTLRHSRFPSLSSV